MQKKILYSNYDREGRATLALFGNACYQVIVLCIALPLACFVMFAKGIHLTLRLLANLSFACFVWIFLASVVLLFLLLLTVQLAAASVG